MTPDKSDLAMSSRSIYQVCRYPDFMRNRSGSAAIEFALVANALLLTIVFMIALGYILYINQALDRAAALGARQIMIGAVQKTGMGQSSFRTSVVCPNLPAAVNCSDVIVNVQTLAEAAQPAGYYAFVNSTQTSLLMPTLSNAATTFAPGTQGAYVYLQLIYPVTFLPAFMTSMLGGGAAYNGMSAYLVVATAAFRNEQF